MPNRPTIRPVAQRDRSEWEPLWEGYNRFYERKLPADITDTTWSRFFDPAEPVHALVAERDGELLGLAHYLFHRSTIMIAPTCYLQDLFTAEEARGQGIGRALIEAVYERAPGRRRAAGLLADPRDQPDSDGAVRSGRGAVGVSGVPQEPVMVGAGVVRIP